MKNQKISIGVDGGATHTTALVIDEAGRELARVVGGPGIVNPSDPPACAGRLAALARRAIAAAEAFPPVEELSCALAGAGRRDVREVVHAELVREHIAHRVTVTTDAEAALTDAFDGAAGILLIAGTGSIAWGRAEDGRLERCGGWGALLGDEGSGYALGLGALRSTVRGADGREPAARLHGAVLAELGLERPEALISWAAAAGKELRWLHWCFGTPTMVIRPPSCCAEMPLARSSGTCRCSPRGLDPGRVHRALRWLEGCCAREDP